MLPTIQISPSQIEFFRTFGYLALDVITTQDEIRRMREIYDRLFANRTGRETGNQFDLAGTDEEGVDAKLPQILGPSRFEPDLKDSLYMANAQAISHQLLGDDILFQGDHAILKPARSPAATPWHQDEAYWGPDVEYNALSVWMPLQDVDMSNGCMCFIPGTHTWEVRPHHCINHDPRIHGLEIDEADLTGMVACPLPAGGATFHLSRVLHYTPPNNTDGPRRAYIVGFGTAPKPRATPRDFYWNRLKQTPREERARKANSTDRGLNEPPLKPAAN